MDRLPRYEQDHAFGQLMLTLRTAIGLTQAGLAEYLGVSRRAIGDWEVGNNYPKAEHLKHFIALAIQQKAFPTGREDEEIRALWRAARQKVLLDEAWFTSLLAPRPVQESPKSEVQSPKSKVGTGSDFVGAVREPPLPTSDFGLMRAGGERKVTINLPFQPTPFFGRAAESAEITRILADPACHLLTLLGPGGVGKTRLAIEVAAGFSEENSHSREGAGTFRDGAVFVPLASVGTPDQIVSSIGEALHLSFAGQQDATASLLDYLHERQMLLVLDNFEHLLEGVALISRILESAPGVTILVTSLERLNLQAEWLFDVEGLAYPVQSQRQRGEGRPFANLADLAEYSAIQLFVQRARQIQPNLPLTESTLTTVAQISQHVAGMPLAIELAAAGVRTLTIDKIEQQLRTNLDVLATTLRDVPARHRSMRAAFDHSWNLLSEPERVLFSRLAVFRGGCTVEGAQQVAGGTLQLLTSLVEKSLLCLSGSQREAATDWTDRATHHAEAPTSGVRFFLLEPLREYALEKLAERGEVERLQRAHAEYYLARAEAVEAQWNSPTADEAIAQLDRPNNNIRAALQWALDTSRAEGGRAADHSSGPSSALLLGLRLAVILRRYWQRRGYFSEGRAWLEDLLAIDVGELPDDDQDTTAYLTARLHAIDATAWLASDQNDYARSEQLFEQSMALRRILGEAEAEGQTSMLVHAARKARSVGEYPRAISLLEDAVSRQRALEHRGGRSTGGLGMVLYELGLVRRERDDFAGASALFQESLELHRELGDREGIAVGLLGLGDIARDQADAAQIRKYCEQSLTICRELGLLWAVGFLLNNLAWAAYLDNDLPQASDLIGESVSLFRDQHAEASLGEVLITQGHILRAQGDLVSSYRAMAEALRVVQALGPRLMVAVALESLAGLLAQAELPAAQSARAREQAPAANLAVQILGAAAALRGEMGTPARPLDRVLETPEVKAARSTEIGATITSLWGEGNRVSLEQILNAIPSVASFEEMLAQAQAALPETSTEGRELRTEDTKAIPESALSPKHSAPSPPSAPETRTRADWAGALLVPHFYGREWELAMLTQWIVEERCRMVSVLGIGGIGKSALSINLMHRVAPNFEAVIWRSVRDAPSCEGLIDECLQVLAPEALADLREPGGTQDPLAERINLLLKNLRSTRTLLVIDNAESLLDEGERTGHMRPGYEGYGRLLRRIGESEHRSCLLLTSREKFEDLAPLEGSTSPVRVLRLSRLGPSACAQLLAEKGVAGTETEQAQLIEQYGGNPLALKIVAQTILDLFGGDAAAFEEQGQVIYGGVRDLLAEQFNRLSAVQQSIMFWLAILREPCTLEDILSLMVVPAPRVWLLDGIEALHRRSLVEPGGGGQGGSGTRRGTFTLQSVVLEYVTERLIGEVSGEIEAGRLALLTEHGFNLAQVPEYVRQAQERLIATPLLQRLHATYHRHGSVEERLLSLLSKCATLADDEQGYGPANLVALLRLHRGNLCGLDLSRLALREAYLQGVEMQDASLSGALIHNSAFTETFDSILAVAISSDGKYIAACGAQGDIRMWSIADYALQRIWTGLKRELFSFALAPDGRTVVGGDWGGMIHLWDVATGALLWSSASHTTMINSLLFTPDGSLIVSCADDSTVRLWDARSGDLLQILQHPTAPHSIAVPAISCDPKQQFLASSDSDGRIYLWALHGSDQAALVATIAEHSRAVTGLAFSPDGRTLASASWDGTVKLWSVPEGLLVETLPGERGPMSRVAWSPDGRTLACSGQDNMIWLWRVEDAAYRTVLRGHAARIRGMAFTPDSRSLLSGGDDGTLRIWDALDGRCIYVMQGYRLTTNGVMWSPDSKWLAGISSAIMLTIYDAEGILPPRLLSGHTRRIEGWNWSPDSRRLASADMDNTIHIWDIHTGESLLVLHYPDDPANIFNDVDWSSDGRWLAATSTRHGVVLWDMARSVATPQHRPFHELLTEMNIAKWHPLGTHLACSDSDGNVVVLDPVKGVLLHKLGPHPGLITSIAWSPGGTMLLLGCNTGVDGAFFVWDVQQEKIVRAVTGEVDLGVLASWGHDEQEVVSGGVDGKLRWWNVESGECVRVHDAHRGALRSVVRSPDGSKLATCSNDDGVMLWDIRTGKHIRTLRRDRPYERLDITGVRGLTQAQKATLRALGAIES